MANMTIIGLPAYQLDAITLGVSEVSTLPKSNLDDPEPWRVCRINTLDPRLSYVEAGLKMPNNYYGALFRVSGVGVVNHSLELGATWRTVLLDSNAAGYQPERVIPNGKTDIVGVWSGTAADVDEDPYSPDANKNTINGAVYVTGTVDYDFATPARDPLVGAGVQLMRVKVSWTGSSTPTVGFNLYDGASDLGSIAYNYPGWPPLASGDVVFLPWDATNLITANGSGVKLRVSATALSSSTLFSVEAVDWLCSEALSAGNILADSYFLPATHDAQDTLWGDTVVGALGLAPQQTLAWSAAQSSATSFKVVTWFRDPLNSAGYIDVGRYVVGPGFTPTKNREWGQLVSLVARDTALEGEGGSRFGVRREPLRVLHVPLDWLTPAEAHSLFERLWRAGTLTPMIVALKPNDATEQYHLTIYGTAANLPQLSAPLVDGYRSIAFDVVEKL